MAAINEPILETGQLQTDDDNSGDLFWYRTFITTIALIIVALLFCCCGKRRKTKSNLSSDKTDRVILVGSAKENGKVDGGKVNGNVEVRSMFYSWKYLKKKVQATSDEE